ncbi:MAG: pilus assembly PilX N-terminal domain-containing protein [Deltaproteobacteria bacterium]|nr:pilus assembly PilX N-terminal domain-containing protein [Deltaproteobacteria bacterium]
MQDKFLDFGDGRRPDAGLPEGSRRGMILVTTLVLMLMVTVIGATVLFSSRSEVATTGAYRRNMSAFNYADALALLGTRVVDVLSSGTVDDVRDHLESNISSSGLKVALRPSLNNFNTDASSERLSIKKRYEGLGQGEEGADLVVTDKNDRVIGFIKISHDFMRGSTGSNRQVGASGGIADKGNTGIGTVNLQYYVITVTARDPADVGSPNFFNNADENFSLSGSQSFITVLYSVVKPG